MNRCETKNVSKEIDGQCGQQNRARRRPFSQIRDVFRFYGLLNNVNEKNLILKQPKQLKEKKYALEKKTAIKIVANTNTSMRRTLLQFLCMTGMRIAEAAHIRPEYFSFVDEKGEKTTKDKMFRMRVDLPAKITKNKTERYVLVHKDIQEAVLRLVENTSAKTKWQKHSNPNEYVFHTAISASSAENNEERAFSDQRKRMINDGFEEMGLKYETGRHKITLHTMRSMFITIANRVSGSDLAGDFGDNIADHNDGSMKAIYDRMPENMVINILNCIFETVRDMELSTLQMLTETLHPRQNERWKLIKAALYQFYHGQNFGSVEEFRNNIMNLIKSVAPVETEEIRQLKEEQQLFKDALNEKQNNTSKFGFFKNLSSVLSGRFIAEFFSGCCSC